MRRAPALLAAAALIVGSTALAAPAAAADLPVGDTLYVIGENTLYTSGSDGTLTEVVNVAPGFVFGADYDPTSGLVYYFIDGGPSTACELFTLDLATGLTDSVGYLDFNECDALDIATDGTLRIGNDDGYLAVVDKADGSTLSSVTLSISLSWLDQAPGGQFYAGDYPGNLYTLDPATGATTLVAAPTFYWVGGKFDTVGTLWAAARTGPEGCQGLASLSLDDPEESYLFEGDFLEDGSCVDGYALFIVPPPKPVLPATGPSMVLPLAGIAGLAMLAGLTVLIRSRRTA